MLRERRAVRHRSGAPEEVREAGLGRIKSARKLSQGNLTPRKETDIMSHLESNRSLACDGTDVSGMSVAGSVDRFLSPGGGSSEERFEVGSQI